MTIKTCRTCGATKPHTEFYVKDANGSLDPDCKPCSRIRWRERYYASRRAQAIASYTPRREPKEVKVATTYTYQKQTHDPASIRYKVIHASKRLIELQIALRNIGEEMKDLGDMLQDYAASRNWAKKREEAAAQANTRSKANGHTNPTGGAYMAGKKAGQAEVHSSTEEPDKLNHLKQLIYRWLVNAPTDDPAEIAPLIPAPVSMVRRIRTQMVDAGKLRPLDAPAQEPKQEQLNV